MKRAVKVHTSLDHEPVVTLSTRADGDIAVLSLLDVLQLQVDLDRALTALISWQSHR